jgi:hypothetical protein
MLRKKILVVKDALTTTTISITNTTRKGKIPGIIETESAGKNRQLDVVLFCCPAGTVAGKGRGRPTWIGASRTGVRMQHFAQNKQDFVYPVYLFRFATKAQSGEV